MPTKAKVFFILAAVLTTSALSAIGRGDPRGGLAYKIGYVFGLFLLPTIFLIGGLIARKSSK
ncbi:hypothetical protein AB1L42_16700 [Thalassoglobus sp. JC818]|uniref:hypothetical protein n=1 Tax=Thalassoglobus sp. JC818 TaxID=3232136 RepID=UPI00345B3DAE